MRAIYTSFLALLVTVAMFWGNCLTCPQVLQALQNHQPAHGCCHGPKRASDGCQTQALRNFVKADAARHVQPVAAPAAIVQLAAAAHPAPMAIVVPAPDAHAPQDLISLHGSFRI
ncbi:MAG TPA: hypothetical protein VE959_33390 [Bryobacteraceae bacterium]|nr:hypothetical protein [Bryobacteraceae bacterium]